MESEFDLLTVQKLKNLESGKQFAKGTGTYPELVNHPIRWVAKRGEGYHDWAIYYGYENMPEDVICRIGTKCFTEYTIKRLVPCTDEAYKLYRL